MRDILRRDMVRGLLSGAGALALRSAATGLPAAFLLSPSRFAHANNSTLVDPAKAQFLVVALSDAGEPINCNGPGSYAFADMIHPMGFAKTPLRLGQQVVDAAQAWNTLPQWALDRAMFLQHTTRVSQHGSIGSVLRLMGATQRGEMALSMFASHLAGALNTLQNVPVSVDASSAPVVLVAKSAQIPSSSPAAWKELIGQYESVPEAMQRLRDQTTDKLYAVLKRNGTRAQLRYLDSVARSSADARQLGREVGSLLNSIRDDGSDGQLKTAIAIVKMKLAPVVAVHLNFGGDNHGDARLENEARDHGTALTALARFFDELKVSGLEDKVTFACLSVFGRNFRAADTARGRDHWGPHTTSFVVGKNVRPGLFGGIVPQGGDYYATGIDSSTGRGVVNGGDISFDDTLASFGKTLGAALGIQPSTVNDDITAGKVITGVLT